jgi:hypothetical protein
MKALKTIGKAFLAVLVTMAVLPALGVSSEWAAVSAVTAAALMVWLDTRKPN